MRSILRRFFKGLTWKGDISRESLAAALRRERAERQRLYGQEEGARMVPMATWEEGRKAYSRPVSR